MNNEEQAEEVAPPQDGEPTVQDSPSEEQAPVEDAREAEPASPEDTPESTEEPLQPETEDKKPTRAERRVHQLLDKLKERPTEPRPGTPQYQPSHDGPPFADAPWNAQTDTSMWQQDREYTPQEIEAEVNRRAATAAELQTRRVLQEYEQRQQYNQSVNHYTNDLEQVATNPEFSDKGFETAFIKLYERLNFENGQFVPRATPREIYNDLREARESGRTSGQREVTTKLAQQAAQQAVTPSGDTGPTDTSIEDLRSEMIRNPGKVARLLEKRLDHAED